MAEVDTVPHASSHNLGGSSRPTSMMLSTQGGCGSNVRNRLALDTAVNQNGSFEFDRVVKAGSLQKRTSRTKKWKPVYIVLRPTTLSIYRSDSEDKLRHKIYLSELTAVAQLRDPKHKRNHLFGIFTASRNFHFQAATQDDANDWIQLMRQGARIEEEEQEMFLASPIARRQSSAGMDVVPPFSGSGSGSGPAVGRGRTLSRETAEHMVGTDRLLSSSPEPLERPSVHFATTGQPDSSGNDVTAYSDFSDGEMQQRMHGLSIESLAQSPPASMGMGGTTAYPLAGSSSGEPGLGLRNGSQVSGINMAGTDPDRVIFQGKLHYLRSKGGVRQWKNTWAVLRPRNLILYKDESEYTAQLIVPLAAIVHVVNIDPLSKTKTHCFQAITEEKTYKFAAPDEEALVQCLGAFKSLLAKRRGLEARTAAAVTPPKDAPAS